MATKKTETEVKAAETEEVKKPAAKKTTTAKKSETADKPAAEKKTAAPKKSVVAEKPAAEEKATAAKKPAAKKPAEKAPEAEVKKPAAEKKEKAPKAEKTYASRVQEMYEKQAAPALVAKFGYKNPMQVPKIVKIVISSGLGDIKDNSKSIQIAQNELKQITGQQPILCKAKKSVANFKVREGMPIGLKVTLRGKMMYDFYDKFVSIALPRVRDFRGVPADSFDGRGNYCMGIKEQLIFPEIQYDQVEKIRGMDICIVTTANTDEEARELLRAMGMPFKK